MGKTSEMSREVEIRRERVLDCWARGLRCLTKISKEVGADRRTIKKDIDRMRKQMIKDPLDTEKICLVREEIAQGLKRDIEEIDRLIAKAIEDKREISEAAVTAGLSNGEGGKSTTQKKTRQYTDYYAVSSLMQRKLEARKRLAELYGLTDANPAKVSVNVRAEANATADANITGINDADLYNATKNILDRVSSSN